MIKSKFYIIFSINITYSVNFIYCNKISQSWNEEELCRDSITQETGCCQRLHFCPSALGDLKKEKVPTMCSYKEGIPVVCCKDLCDITYNATDASKSNHESVKTTEENSKRLRISQRKCLEYTAKVAYFEDKFDDHFERELHITRRRRDMKMDSGRYAATDGMLPPHEFIIIGGVESKLNEFPHMVALGWYTTQGTLKFSCGGSLISDKYVLTAGHCTSTFTGTFLNQSEPSIVRLGDLNIVDGIVDNASPIDIAIKRIIKHPRYKPPKKYNDIALLELRDKVEINRNNLPACLWTENDFGVHTIAISTGWGTTKLGGTNNSPVLQKVIIDIIDSTICDNFLRVFRNRHWQGIKDDQMCAGILEGGKDTCQGDSGGPLQIITEDGRHYIIGVTSFGKQCAKPNQPGVYSKVSHFIDWIESIVWANSS